MEDPELSPTLGVWGWRPYLRAGGVSLRDCVFSPGTVRELCEGLQVDRTLVNEAVT